MTGPIIHPTSAINLATLVRDLPQSLLLTGPQGIGLNVVGRYIAAELGVAPYVVLPEKDEKIDIEKGIISVESIRRLYDLTRTIQSNKQIILIDYAERMGHQAQNAFLKLLEEPNRSTYFILATHSPQQLLPTIISRTQELPLRPVTIQQSDDLLDELKVTDLRRRSQLLFMAEGLPAELTRLITNNDYFEWRSQIVRDARELLQGSTYRKLQLAHTYKDKRSQALIMLQDAAGILRRSIAEKSQANILTQISDILQASERIEANGNIRLCLARLV